MPLSAWRWSVTSCAVPMAQEGWIGVGGAAGVHHGGMVLMAVTGVVLLVGVALTVWWSGTGYVTWEPGLADDADRRAPPAADDQRPSVRTSGLRYLRGVAIALVAGFWAGVLVTGPAVRLIMRLLAVTAGDDAQGRITEADEVVGRISLDGTIGLLVFGGILPGLLSGAIYVVCRRWLPGGRLAGVVFGGLHLVVAATRIDPLRPDNPDFDIVGPGWLSVTTFGLASILHGMAVVAIANRYSHSFPPDATSRAGQPGRGWAIAPLVPPVLMLVPGFVLLLPIVVGLAITCAASRVGPVVRAVRSRGALLAGRIAIGVAAVALLPGTIIDLRDVIDRDDGIAAPADRLTQRRPHGVDGVEVLQGELRARAQGATEASPITRGVRRHEAEEGSDDRVAGLDAMDRPRLVESDVGTTGGAQGVEVEPQEVALRPPALLGIDRHRQEVADVA
jgi:hypothetical protein